MSRQIKCTKCGNWNNEALEACENCSNPLHESFIRELNKVETTNYQQFVGKLKGQSDWIEKFFEKAKKGNIFMKGLAYFLQTIWMIYFGMLLAVAWLVFIVAG